MIGIYDDDIITSGAQSMCDEVFDQLIRRFPVKTLGENIGVHWLRI